MSNIRPILVLLIVVTHTLPKSYADGIEKYEKSLNEIAVKYQRSCNLGFVQNLIKSQRTRMTNRALCNESLIKEESYKLLSDYYKNEYLQDLKYRNLFAQQLNTPTFRTMQSIQYGNEGFKSEKHSLFSTLNISNNKKRQRKKTELPVIEGFNNLHK